MVPPKTSLAPRIFIPSHLFMVGVGIVYLCLMFLLPSLLPDQFSFDAIRIANMMEDGAEGTGSYARTAQLLGLLPDALMMPFIASLGLAIIYFLCGSAKTFKAQAAISVLLLPVLLLCLLRPQKEVFVVVLSLASVWAVFKFPTKWAFLAIVSFYLVYGGFMRTYFLLMMPVFLGLMVWEKATPMVRTILFLVFLATLLMVPSNIFLELQGARDIVNMHRVLGTEGNRTFFNNPLYPDTLFNFLGNYAYAVVRLNFPILFSVAPQEVFLFLTVLAYLLIGKAGYKWGNEKTRLLTHLFLAHWFILMLFEPDLGSYMRHMSSVLLYLWPAFILWQGGKNADEGVTYGRLKIGQIKQAA